MRLWVLGTIWLGLAGCTLAGTGDFRERSNLTDAFADWADSCGLELADPEYTFLEDGCSEDDVARGWDLVDCLGSSCDGLDLCLEDAGDFSESCPLGLPD